MKKILTGLLGALSLMTTAAPLTPEAALSRALGDAASGDPSALRSLRMAPQMRLVHTAMTTDEMPAAYIYTTPSTQGGYLIVGADDLEAPLLGYSDHGAIDADNIPCGLQSMLDFYARRLEAAREAGALPYAKTMDAQAVGTADAYGREPISPMLTTKWNQGTPYNDACPVNSNNGSTCYTGCVATAMAQVLNYHQHPITGSNYLSFSNSAKSSEYYSGIVSFDYEMTTFDYANMLDSYSGSYTDAQADAVAQLMYGCGASVYMQYRSSSSGTYSTFIPYALGYYLGYQRQAECMQRDYYFPSDGWDDYVYNNLVSYGPTIYDGIAPDGGHSFVCDGYSSDGYFHFNWGWSGSSDGYFLLDNLDPESQGIGGSAGNLAFNSNQDIIANVKVNDVDYYSDTSEWVPCIVGTGDFELPSTATLGKYIEIKYGAANMSQVNWNIDFGIMISTTRTGTGTSLYFDYYAMKAMSSINTAESSAGQYFPSNIEGAATLPGDLAAGIYYVRPCYRQKGATTWHYMQYPLNCKPAWLMTVASDGSCTLTSDNVPGAGIATITASAADSEVVAWYDLLGRPVTAPLAGQPAIGRRADGSIVKAINR